MLLISLGILLALVLSVAGAVWFSLRFARQKREEAPARLQEARRLLAEGHDGDALAMAGRAFWAAPDGIYTAEQAQTALGVIGTARAALANTKTFDEIDAALETIRESGGQIEADVLAPVATFMHDVADDLFLAEKLTERAREEGFELP